MSAVTKSYATLASYMQPLTPVFHQGQVPVENVAQVTEANFAQVTEASYVPRQLVDVSSLAEQVIASPSMQSFIAAHRSVDVDTITERIIATGQLQASLRSNERPIDVEAVTWAVLTSAHMREFLEKQVTSKETDLQDVVARILGSEELRRWLHENRQLLNVDEVAERVVASRRLDDWLRTNEIKVDGSQLVAQLASSAEWQELVDERRRTDETTLTRLRAELDEKSRLLSEQRLALEQLSADLSRVQEQMKRMEAESQGALDARLKLHSEEQVRLLQEQQARLSGSLSSCCNQTAVEEKVARALAAALGADKYVSRADFESRLANATAQIKRYAAEAARQSADSFSPTIGRLVREQLAAAPADSGAEQVRAIVAELLAVYDADKTGMVDHALESSGGEVLSTRCTETFPRNVASFTVFGIPLWSKSNNPRSVIQPTMHPGECWAFRGSQGFLVIKLAGLVRVTSFSVEHIPRVLAFGGNIDSAPKDFTVLGLESLHDMEPFELGKFTYLQNSTSLQHFTVQQADARPFRNIELRIESNHGNQEYTCLYRFRVHGTWISY